MGEYRNSPLFSGCHHRHDSYESAGDVKDPARLIFLHFTPDSSFATPCFYNEQVDSKCHQQLLLLSLLSAVTTTTSTTAALASAQRSCHCRNSGCFNHIFQIPS
eukprot:5305456-Ditylum_brightwellii.AAC.1